MWPMLLRIASLSLNIMTTARQIIEGFHFYKVVCFGFNLPARLFEFQKYPPFDFFYFFKGGGKMDLKIMFLYSI
jgi:hypothetical protein